jgi:peptidoglycan-associated lipoprotein
MRFRNKCKFALLLAIAAVSTAKAVAQADPASLIPPRTELALDYTYVRTNAPPGGCGCFNLNGGSASIAWPVRPGKFFFVADLSIGGASKIVNTNYNLTLGSFNVGARYQLRTGRSPFRPFGQALVGATRGTGTLVLSPNPAALNSNLEFSAVLGGGVDLHTSRHTSLRLAEADYFVTTFGNGVNDHQNNLRLSSGLVFHF